MDRRVAPLLATAAGCAVAFAVVCAAAYYSGRLSAIDQSALTGFNSVNDGFVEWLTGRLVKLGDPPAVALITLALAGLAVARGRPWAALAVILLVAATSVSSEVLKPTLAHWREASIEPWGTIGFKHAFPSGHATAAMSLALAAVIAAPPRARPGAAVLGALLALAVGASVVANGWHFPSDVIGGYLLASGWALVLVAALLEVERRFGAGERRTPAASVRLRERAAGGGRAAFAALVVVAAILAAVVFVAAEPREVVEFARDHTESVVVAGGLVAVALTLPAAMAALVRRG